MPALQVIGFAAPATAVTEERRAMRRVKRIFDIRFEKLLNGMIVELYFKLCISL